MFHSVTRGIAFVLHSLISAPTIFKKRKKRTAADRILEGRGLKEYNSRLFYQAEQEQQSVDRQDHVEAGNQFLG